MDEVDKLGRDFRGDPSIVRCSRCWIQSRTISVPRQLSRCQPFDLVQSALHLHREPCWTRFPSRCAIAWRSLICTGYTEEEKTYTSPSSYLIPRQIAENGIERGADLEFSEESVRLHRARHYTREAGVRSLEQPDRARSAASWRESIAEGNASEKLDVTPEIVRQRNAGRHQGSRRHGNCRAHDSAPA